MDEKKERKLLKISINPAIFRDRYQ